MAGGKVPGPIGAGTNQPVVDGGTSAMTDHQVPQSKGLKVEPVGNKVNGTIIAGGPLSKVTQEQVSFAALKTPTQWRRYIAFADVVHVGGSLAWRANNPGNLRGAATKIGSVSGAVGSFAVFASIEDGRTAQRTLYLDKYGSMKVKDAINKLTPPSENDTVKYLAELKRAGVDLDKDVKSQIDILMPAVVVNEGLIVGIVVKRMP